VLSKTVRPVELHRADGAAERLFAGVDAEMFSQVARPAELPTADEARVRPVAGMRAPVLGQMAGLEEFPIADVARKRAFVRVDSHVTFHSVDVHELIANQAGAPTSTADNW